MVKILFLAANPIDTDQLRLSEEVRAIQERLRASELRDNFKVEQEWAVRISDIQAHLLRHKPDIVHFSGHGSKTGEIVLEDAAGYSKTVSTQALKTLFKILKDSIKCVVLNACFSRIQAEAIAESINCVVGMSTSIGDGAAIAFAASFYQALGYGRSISEAFQLGCSQIELEGFNEQDTPQLVTATGVDANRIYLSHNSTQSLPSHTKESQKMNRNELMRKLNSLSSPQFNELIFNIKPPAGIVPPPSAAQGDRVFALLSWAEGTGGCGLMQVEQALEAVTIPQ